ncbi:MAG: hypothetical protein ABW208_09335 [Pyrinomonadaceae bacterium]
MSREFFQRSEVFIGRLERVEWRAHEVIKELDDRPHLLVRIEIAGPYFPHRAVDPYVRILRGDQVVAESWFAKVSDDNRRILAYFPTDVPEGEVIEFGYEDDMMGRIRTAFDSGVVRRLERERLPKEVLEVTDRYVKSKRI